MHGYEFWNVVKFHTLVRGGPHRHAPDRGIHTHGCNLASDGAVSFGQTMSNLLQRRKPVSCANAVAAT